MKDTRYWRKCEVQGILFSRCDEQEARDDGRREYTYKFPKPGSRWQYETDGFSGTIETVKIKENPWGEEELMIGIQSDDRVNVLQIPVWHKKHPKKQLSQDFKGFAKKIPNLNAEAQLDVSVYIDTKHPRQWTDRDGNVHTSIGKYISLGQFGRGVKSAFNYVDGKYEGVPEIKVVEVDGEEIRSHKAQTEFFLGLVTQWAEENAGILDAARESRPSTPSESEAALAGNVDEDEDFDFE